MPNNDANLIKRAKSGDNAAFDEIYESHYQRIYTYVYYRVNDVSVAEDFTSEVFVRLVQKISSYEDRGKPLIAWLYTIAGNLIRDNYGREKDIQWLSLDDRALPSNDDPARMTQQKMTSELLARLVQNLTEEQTQLILLKFVDGLNNGEIAEIMGKREGSIKSMQHRALRSIQKLLEQEAFEE